MMLGGLRGALAPHLFWIKLGLAAAAVSVAALAIGHRVNVIKAEAHNAGANEVRAELAAAERIAARRAFTESERRLKEDQNAQQATAEALRRKDVAVAAARSELGRLQDYVADRERRLSEASDAVATGGADGAGAEGWRLLGACAERYAGLAGEADTVAARLTGLQRWVSSVCTEQVAGGGDGGRLDR